MDQPLPRPRRVREAIAIDRPRERLAQAGPAVLSTPELVALVWGTGVPGVPAEELATRALERLDGLPGLATASAAELGALPGVGPARAARLAAAFELGRRAAATWPERRWVIRAPRDLADRLLPEMGRLEREELRVAHLDARNAVLGVSTVYVGNVSAALVRVGELFRDAIRRQAAGLIVVHNHPSGDPTPSPDDLHLTAEAVAAGRLLDLPVLDHVILGHGTFVSLRDRGIPFDRGRIAA
ncbi:MAG: DNA repair protein RadC [Chloroflexota bacterium]